MWLSIFGHIFAANMCSAVTQTCDVESTAQLDDAVSDLCPLLLSTDLLRGSNRSAPALCCSNRSGHMIKYINRSGDQRQKTPRGRPPSPSGPSRSAHMLQNYGRKLTATLLHQNRDREYVVNIRRDAAVNVACRAFFCAFFCPQL